MEEHNSPPSDQIQAKPSRFKIPKRKANSWTEEITVTSPLSRCSNSNFQNCSKQEPRSWSSPYNTFNRTRNHDSFRYYGNNRNFNRQSPHPASSRNRFEQHPEFVTSPIDPALQPREQSANSVLSPGRCGKHELKVEAKQLDTLARNRRCGTPLTEEHLSFSTEKAAIQSEETTDCSTTSVSGKRSSEKYSCYSENSPSPEHLQETARKPQEAEDKEVSKDCKKDLSFTSEKGPVLEHSPKAKNCKVSTENILHTSESFSTHKLKTNEKMLTRRKCRERGFRTNPSKNPVEPIVLSSDEEDEVSTDPENTQIVHFSTTQNLSSDKKEAELNSQCPLAERLASHEGENQKVEQNLMRDDHLCSGKMGATSMCKDEKSSPVLEIEFSTVYFGKKKGRAKGCLKFSAATIEIPHHEALRSTMTLPVDCRYLKKCGLWMNRSEFSVRSDAFIFLWISEDYAAEIQKKLQHPLSPHPTKANQFIFLELERTLTDEEQDKLHELMREWSMKNRQAELSDWLSWEEASPLLEDLSKDECSFLSNCNISFHKEEGKGATEDAKPKPQDTNVNIAKPSFTLVQKCTLNNYAVSLIPKPDGEWKEIKAKGPSVQKLIVYPPPPTKGGLGVTQEDLECLEQGEFLNDVIIDFYLKYLLLEKIPHQLAERSHIFSSFFFKCLTRTETPIPDESPNTAAAQRRHHRVKTWTRHVDIFKKDFIFVPVNEESHWYLAVICFPHLEKSVYEERKRPTEPPPQVETEEQEDSSRKSTVIVFNDACSRREEMGGNSSPQSEGDGDPPSATESSTTKNYKGLLEKHSGKTKVCRRPCILILDSLKAGSVQNTASVLREYLEVEWSVKRKSAREFSRSSMRDFCPRVPKQDNSSDCGVYLLQYVESFFKTPIVSFEPPMHMEHWFPRHVVRSKREEIRDLILRLHIQQKSAHSS